MLVAGFGIPGSGKSTVMRKLSELLSAHCFLEPEEASWGAAVSERDVCGHVTALHYFRAERVPMLYAARSAASTNCPVFIDSVYDKLCHLYIKDPSFHWLIRPDDKYYENFMELCRLDYENLPDPDVLLMLEVTLPDWEQMLVQRGRDLDKSSNLSDNIQMQDAMISAAMTYEKETDGRVKLIRFKNKFSSVEMAAKQIAELIRPLLK